MSVKDKIKQLKDKINRDKRFGEGTILTAAEAAALKVQRFSTGILDLDIGTGGGYPEGRITIFVGHESAGKSTACYIGAYQYLLKYPNGVVLIIDTEYSVTPKYLVDVGFTQDMIERTLIVFPDSGEQAGDVMIEVLSLIEGDDNCLAIVDSIASMSPTAEIEESMDHQGMGLQARLMNKFFRKLLPVMKQQLDMKNPKTTVFMVNQIREKIGVMYGNPETEPAGRGQKFYASMKIQFRSGGFIKDGKQPVGINVHFNVKKNKVGGTQGSVGEFAFYFRDYGNFTCGDIDNCTALRTHGVLCGIVEQGGKWYHYDGEKYNGGERFDTMLRDRPEVAEDIHRHILQHYGYIDADKKEAKPKQSKKKSPTGRSFGKKARGKKKTQQRRTTRSKG